VPGAPKGLEEVHRRFGKLPGGARRAGDRAGSARCRDHSGAGLLHQILDPILRHNAHGRQVYETEGRRYQAGDVFRPLDLVGTLEQFAVEGAGALYGGELGRRLVAHIQSEGGRITLQDLERYRVVWRRLVRSRYRGCEFVSNPPPSSGGILVAYGLRLLDELGEGGAPGSTEALVRLVEVMREQTRARSGGVTPLRFAAAGWLPDCSRTIRCGWRGARSPLGLRSSRAAQRQGHNPHRGRRLARQRRLAHLLARLQLGRGDSRHGIT